MNDSLEFKTRLIVAFGILSLASTEQISMWKKIVKKDKASIDRKLLYSLDRTDFYSYSAGKSIDFKASIPPITKKVFKVKKDMMGRMILTNEFKATWIPKELLRLYIEYKAAFMYLDKNLRTEITNQGLEREFYFVSKNAKRYINFFERELKDNEEIYR